MTLFCFDTAVHEVACSQNHGISVGSVYIFCSISHVKHCFLQKNDVTFTLRNPEPSWAAKPETPHTSLTTGEVSWSITANHIMLI